MRPKFKDLWDNPASLKAVAVLCFLVTVEGLVNIVRSLMHGHVMVDLNILGYWDGLGLLKHRGGCRTVVMLSSGFASIVGFIMWIYLFRCLAGGGLMSPHEPLLNAELGRMEIPLWESELGFPSPYVWISPWYFEHPKWAFAYVTIGLVLLVWTLYVLTKPSIRLLFKNSSVSHSLTP